MLPQAVRYGMGRWIPGEVPKIYGMLYIAQLRPENVSRYGVLVRL